MFRNASSRIEGVKEFKLEDYFAHFFESGKIYNNYFTRMNATVVVL